LVSLCQDATAPRAAQPAPEVAKSDARIDALEQKWKEERQERERLEEALKKSEAAPKVPAAPVSQ